MDLSGVIPPMVTPTEARDGGIRESVLQSYTEFLIDQGVHGLFPCGSIGEFPSLSREERQTVIDIVSNTATGIPVLAGCSDTCLSNVMTNIHHAATAGADAAVVVTPYYLSTNQQGLHSFYEHIADRATIPIVLYNIPQLTGIELSPSLVGDLADHENIVGIKDSAGSISDHYRFISETPPDFSVIQGLSMLAVTALNSGADGVISGAANVFPGPLAELYTTHQAGRRQRAVAIANQVACPLVEAYTDLPTASAVKFLVKLAGYEVGPPVIPLPELDEHQRQRLRERYNQVKLATDEQS